MSEDFNFNPFTEEPAKPTDNSLDTMIDTMKQEQKQLNEFIKSQPKDVQINEVVNEIEDEDNEENTENIVIINRYKTSIFAEYLRDNNIKFVIKDAKHNTELLTRIRVLVQNKNGNISDVMCYVSIDILEKFVTNFLDYNISGLSAVCRDDVVMRDNLNEWMIESNISQLKNPKQRLLFNLLKNVYVVYTLNKLKSTIPNESQFITQTSDTTEDNTIKKVIINRSTDINDDELFIN